MKKSVWFLIGLTILLMISLQFPISRELKIIVIAVLVLALIGAAAALFLFGWVVVERIKRSRAGRIEAEKNAHVLTVVAGNQVFIRDTDPHAYWRAAHLDPRFYANGQYSEPSPTEVAAWQAFNRPKVIQEQAGAMLPAQTQVDLLAALDSVQRCLIVGASDSGKTTLLQWLVSRKLSTSRVIVIDPHAYPDKWPAGAHVSGLGRNYPEIDRALCALVQLMTRRYDEIGRGLVAEMAHSRITIIIDEWRAITRQLGKSAEEAIRTLLTESRKAAFSVFVASHSDRARPLGLEGEYDLKDGFTVVMLTVANGIRQATIDAGNGEVPAVLPGRFSGGQPQIIDGRQFHIVDDFDLEPEPDERETEILRMHQNGASISAIARQVLGSKGGYQNQQVKDILVKFKAV